MIRIRIVYCYFTGRRMWEVRRIGDTRSPYIVDTARAVSHIVIAVCVDINAIIRNMSTAIVTGAVEARRVFLGAALRPTAGVL